MPVDFRLPDAAWSGGHLLLGDPAAVGKVRRKLLSASVAAKTLQCPASMAASRLLPRTEDPFGDGEIGTSMHSVFEGLYELPRAERTPEAIDRLVQKGADEVWAISKLQKPSKKDLQANAAGRAEWVRIVGDLAHGIFKIEDPQQVFVVATELNIIVELAGVPTTCYVDRLDWVPAALGSPGSTAVADLPHRIQLAEDAREHAMNETRPAIEELGRKHESELAEHPEADAKGLESLLRRHEREVKAANRPVEQAQAVIDFLEAVLAAATDSGADAGVLAVKDYKKGNDPKKLKTPDPRYGDDYGDQQRLYVAAIEKAFGIRPVSADLLFPALGGKRPINVSGKDVELMLTAYRSAWDLMNASADRSSFETRPSPLCAWCSLANSCPNARVGMSQAKDPAKRAQSIQKQLDAAGRQPSKLDLGIPTIRVGALPAEALSANAPGVTVPGVRRTIEPIGDDLFPVTIYGPPDPTLPAVPDGLPGALSHPAGDLHTDVPTSPFGPRMWVAEDNPAEAGGAENGTMTQNTQGIPVRPEAATYEETVNGALNLNSFAAMAVSGLVATAFEHLEANGQPTSGTTIARFSDVLAGIVLRAQLALTGQANFQRGAQTRLRGLLHTILPQRPAPFGRPAAEWEAWMARTERFLIVSMTEAMNLYDRTPVQNDSHLFFASDVAN